MGRRYGGVYPGGAKLREIEGRLSLSHSVKAGVLKRNTAELSIVSPEFQNSELWVVEMSIRQAIKYVNKQHMKENKSVFEGNDVAIPHVQIHS